MPPVNPNKKIVDMLLNIEVGGELEIEFRAQDNQKELKKFKRIS